MWQCEAQELAFQKAEILADVHNNTCLLSVVLQRQIA
jgi:hypothetical protein